MSLEERFPQLEPALLAEIKEKGTLKHVRAGDIIIKSGQYMPAAQLVLDGLLKVFREDDEGNEFFMYYIHSGQACALSINCAVRQIHSPVMARAMQDTWLISLPITDVDNWFRAYGTWDHFVLDAYRNRFDELLLTLDQIAFRNMDERLLFYLKRYQHEMKTRDVKLTHQEIANELNSSREVISRLLKKMEESGKIRLHRYHIEIVDLE
ncbi:MAG: Crp/Fnr family transcriptional regulator [Bacteroidetes bacterium]|nr:Crp/Fnr family transcriptional regulator [Bacteroidota bacterium]